MRTLILSVALGCAALGVVGGCQTAPSGEGAKADLKAEADAAVAKARKNDPSLGALMDRSLAVAVYPSVGKGGLVVGGAYGRGVLYEKGVMTGYTDITQASVGLQAGGQSYTEILVFNEQGALNHFKTGKLTFDAQATAVAIKSGAGANANFFNGVATFTMAESGLMAEASVGGQRFSFLAK
ncbi:MAG: YSC84-related protein [Phycisphaerales bacterium]